MMKSIMAVCLAIGLVSCAQKPIVEPTIQVHPNWPVTLADYKQQWEVKVIDGQAWVGMPFEASQEFRIWLNDVKRYVHDQKGMLCYYRSELKEERCK